MLLNYLHDKDRVLTTVALYFQYMYAYRASLKTGNFAAHSVSYPYFGMRYLIISRLSSELPDNLSNLRHAGGAERVAF
jgi:hypothetical protein